MKPRDLVSAFVLPHHAPTYCASGITRQQRFVQLLAWICIVGCWHGLGIVQSVAARPVVGGDARAAVPGRALQTSVPAEPTATIVVTNSTSTAADFLGALQSSSETVTATASNGAGLFAQCVCQSAITGLQAQKLASIEVAGASASLGNDTAGGTGFQNLVEVLELGPGDFKASTSSSVEAQATGVRSTSVGLDTVTATNAVQNSSAIDGQGTRGLGNSSAGGDEKEITFSASSELLSGGSSRTRQTNSATVTATNLPGDAVGTPFQTVVVSTGVSVQYVARALVTRDYVEVSVHTEASAVSSIDLVFPDPAVPGRVYRTHIEGRASLTCDCAANATFVNGTDFTQLASASGADEERAGSSFATDPLLCNPYGSSPNMCFSSDGSAFVCCPGACPSAPGTTARCDSGLPEPSSTQTSGDPTSAPLTPGGTNPAPEASMQTTGCPDATHPNPCYNSQGDAFTCCAGSCPDSPTTVPTCKDSPGSQSSPTSLPGEFSSVAPTEAPPVSPQPSGFAGPISCPNASLPNMCFNANGDRYTCCASSCGGPPGDAPFCASDPTPSVPLTPSPTGTDGPTSAPRTPSPTGTDGPTSAPSTSPSPTGTDGQTPTPSPARTGCPTGLNTPQPGNASTACAQSSGQTSSEGTGCTSTIVSITGLAASQAVVQNLDTDALEAAVVEFCKNPDVKQLSISAGLLAERLVTASAAALVNVTATTCACTGTPSVAAASVGEYVSAVAKAATTATAQAFVQVFGSGPCESAPLLAQADGFAESAATSIVFATNAYYNSLSASQGTLSADGQTTCQAEVFNQLKQLQAHAYACAIVTVLSSAYNDNDAFIFNNQTTVNLAGQCSSQLSVAFSDPGLGPGLSCSLACDCHFGMAFAPNPLDGGLTQSCQCANGTAFDPTRAVCA